MNIIVYDVPAEHSGALTILYEYYNKAIEDVNNQWYFIVSTPALTDKNNVRIIKYPWIKKSWLHRLFFDFFIAHTLVKKYNADEVLSLQSIIIPGIKINQTLYIHQPLPFIDKRFRFSENIKFWIYQNVIGHYILYSAKKADLIIVQTEWMKEACIKLAMIRENKIKVIHPIVDIYVDKYYNQNYIKEKLFFYPASAISYKNHKIVINAVKMLNDYHNINNNFRVIFTLVGNENKDIIEMYNEVKNNNLSIEFIGQISIDEVYDYYCKSILLFPSYIETFGLPLLEAKMHKSPILASDCSFSHEILEGYDKVKYFDPFICEELMELMKNEIIG